MSAIWGMVSLDENENISECAKEVFESVYRKCKIDSIQTAASQDAYIGCGIQYVTVEAKAEQLPVQDEERRITFAADCVLDNRADVIELLTGFGYDRQQLCEAADGRLMYLSFVHLGKECVKQFRGLFAIAIWDAENRSLTLLSDQVSARSLYYIRRGNQVAFSTLMKPLLRLFPGIQENQEYDKDFLLVNPSVIYVVPGETPYREISLMLPASEVEFDAAGKRERVYWQQGEAVSGDAVRAKRCKNAQEYSERFMELYADCVRDAVRSSGEVGIAMSSGLDSASVGVLAAQELAKTKKTLHSYTFVPYQKPDASAEGNALYDESGYVQEIAERYPNIRTTFLNNQGKNMFEDMEFCMELLELPYKTGTFPNHYEMCKEGAKAGCRVFLNGGFGNNTVSYGEVNHILYQLYLDKRPVAWLSWLNRYCKHEKIGRKKAVVQMLRTYRTFVQNSKCIKKSRVPDNYYLVPAILENYDWQERFARDKRLLLSEGYLNREDYKEYLKAPALLIYLGVFETKFGLETGMLLRDPTKDIRMLSFCHDLPYQLFAYRGVPRWLIRNGFRELLPEGVLEKWRQKGLLNIDWMDRIYRDWDVLRAKLLEDLSAERMDTWMDKERIKQEIEAFGQNREKDIYVISYLCAIDALLCFRKQKK